MNFIISGKNIDVRELLEPEFGPLYVTPPDIDQSVKQLSFTISEGIHQAVFP